LEQIKETLDGLLKTLKARREKAASSSPELLGKRAFSSKESRHARISGIKNGLLYIKVDSSAWLYYFNLHKKELLEKLSAQDAGIKDFKFSLGMAEADPGRGEKILARKKISGKIEDL